MLKVETCVIKLLHFYEILVNSINKVYSHWIRDLSIFCPSFCFYKHICMQIQLWRVSVIKKINRKILVMQPPIEKKSALIFFFLSSHWNLFQKLKFFILKSRVLNEAIKQICKNKIMSKKCQRFGVQTCLHKIIIIIINKQYLDLIIKSNYHEVNALCLKRIYIKKMVHLQPFQWKIHGFFLHNSYRFIAYR